MEPIEMKMKKQYIQPQANIFAVEISSICTGSQNIPVSGPISGGEEGFEKASSASRYTDWDSYEH